MYKLSELMELRERRVKNIPRRCWVFSPTTEVTYNFGWACWP